jgi:hypothetical protein
MVEALKQEILVKSAKPSSMPKLVACFRKNSSEEQLMALANAVYEANSMDHIGSRK